jgi:hypothetical protein
MKKEEGIRDTGASLEGTQKDEAVEESSNLNQ